jgi:hypothetical protein
VARRIAYLLFLSVIARSLAEDTALVVGPGWAQVRQRVSVEFTNAMQDVAFDFVPPQTDPTSIQVLGARSPVNLLAWRAAEDKHFIATLETDYARLRSFDVAYLVRGPAWQASYQLIVRADPEHDEAPVSMDVDGRVTIRNNSEGSWSNAVLRLVGSAERPAVPSAEHGFLELDETSPLADAWRGGGASDQTDYTYSFARNVTVNPREERSFAFVAVERRSAERRYFLSSDDVALNGSDPGRPLRRLIVLKNDLAHGLGSDLPQGSAQIFIGSVRATLGESAWLGRTPAGGEIRIDLGRSQRVRGIRRGTGSAPGTPGQTEESFEIEIRNDLESAARAEIEERPPVSRDWDVLRTSQPCEIRNRRIFYRVEVPPRDRLIVRYTVRTPTPGL